MNDYNRLFFFFLLLSAASLWGDESAAGKINTQTYVEPHFGFSVKYPSGLVFPKNDGYFSSEDGKTYLILRGELNADQYSWKKEYEKTLGFFYGDKSLTKSFVPISS